MLTRSQIVEVQSRLNSLGFSAGYADGIIGRRTINAIRGFQRTRELKVDGILGPITMSALMVGDKDVDVIDPPWMTIAKNKIGFLEIEARTGQFLRSDNKTLGDPAKFPWCGDFVETCLAVALPSEVLPTNPYWALNWLSFGHSAMNPWYGAVAVFKRPGGGHVGFVVGHDPTYVHVLGGNQSNSVSIAKLAKSRLQGYRWPNTQPLPSGGSLPFSTLSASISRNEA